MTFSPSILLISNRLRWIGSTTTGGMKAEELRWLQTVGLTGPLATWHCLK
jgi:hypothetical protein